jgi:hypothetical protein
VTFVTAKYPTKRAITTANNNNSKTTTTQQQQQQGQQHTQTVQQTKTPIGT